MIQNDARGFDDFFENTEIAFGSKQQSYRGLRSQEEEGCKSDICPRSLK